MQPFSPSPLRADDARQFFLYQNGEDIAVAFAEITQGDPEDITVHIDFGIGEGGDMTGGDVVIGGRRGRYLSEAELIDLAKHMGAESWIKPNWQACFHRF